MQTALLMLLVATAGLGAVRGRPLADAGHVEESEEDVVRAAMIKATRGLNQTQADVVLSTLQHAPVSNTSIRDPTYQAQQKSHRERSREIRIHEIKSRVLGYLERFGRRSGVQPHSRPLFNDPYPLSSPEVFAEKSQSFYPSCELPRNTDEELWSDGKSLNLMFEMSYPTTAEGTVATIIAAKLRLYKLSQSNITILQEICPVLQSTKSIEQVDELTEPPLLPATKIPTNQQPPQENQSVYANKPEQTSVGEEDVQVRVSVYWYTRSLKKHRMKRKLLDSKMFSVFGEEWTEFNIRAAVRAWRDARKNFGLVVEVEDEDGHLLHAAKYFSTMNCTNEASATARPIPGFLVETAQVLLLQNAATIQAESGLNAGTPLALNPIYLNAFLFPMIDMCTLELAKPKGVYDHAQYVLSEKQPSSTEEGGNTPLEQEEHEEDEDSSEDMPYAISYNSHNFDHPHRHNHHQEVQNDSEPDGIGWAHDFRRHIINKTVILQAAQIKQALNSQRDKRKLI